MRAARWARRIMGPLEAFFGWARLRRSEDRFGDHCLWLDSLSRAAPSSSSNNLSRSDSFTGFTRWLSHPAAFDRARSPSRELARIRPG